MQRELLVRGIKVLNQSLQVIQIFQLTGWVHAELLDADCSGETEIQAQSSAENCVRVDIHLDSGRRISHDDNTRPWKTDR